MFYADDAVFMGQRSTKNIDTIIYVLKYFHRASAKYPRLFALELEKDATVASKLQFPLENSFRRSARGGIEQHLMMDLISTLDSISLSNSCDCWTCDLTSDGEFRVKEVRNAIDNLFLPSQDIVTRWVKYVPIKVNIFIWRARQDCLPTKTNLVHRGVNVESCICSTCSSDEEDINHSLFCCNLAQQILVRICRWWDIQAIGWSSFQEWYTWFESIRLPLKVKSMLEGVFFVAWWSIWRFRNQIIFDDIHPRRSVIFDDIVFRAFNWCNSRCHKVFTWENWLKNPHLISL
ncbi:RNA-directed DNA polymerase, eukaryota [Tanacetum coccineum]